LNSSGNFVRANRIGGSGSDATSDLSIDCAAICTCSAGTAARWT
jgi:hypothetical protein